MAELSDIRGDLDVCSFQSEGNKTEIKMERAWVERGEELREAAATGDEMKLSEMLTTVDRALVNSRNAINGWTALHWACKRGYAAPVKLLLAHGADAQLQTYKGETALQLTTNKACRTLLGVERCQGNDTPKDVFAKCEVCKTDDFLVMIQDWLYTIEVADYILSQLPNSEDRAILSEDSKLPFVPHYLVNPVFPYTSASNGTSSNQRGPTDATWNQTAASSLRASVAASTSSISSTAADELVLSARIANAEEKDFIEIDLPHNPSALTFDLLMTTLCRELAVERHRVRKVRKLPDTIVRNDRDVRRLRDFHRLEVVMYEFEATRALH